jgi:hypothetical protein
MALALDSLAREIAGVDGGVAVRARRLTDWLHGSLEWVATDYAQRSVAEILERRAGNCAEQAKVLAALFQAAGIATRWIAELNVHPASDQRQADSEALLGQYGVAATVFGYQHNDHRWLELYEPATGDWLPADATLGIVDYPDWIDARLGFAARPAAAVEMLVPFCVVVLDLARVLHANRTEHYLIDRFNRRYDGQLEKLPAWAAWSAQIHELGQLGARTFENCHDLHRESGRIALLLETYEGLSEQARERLGLVDAGP